MTSSSSFLPTYTPTLPTDLTPETISFLTLLPLLTHTLRTLLTSTTTPRRLRLTPLPRLLLTWSTLFALIVRDTTTQPPSLSTTTTSTSSPASTALLVAAVVPTFLILLDEAIALSGRRQRRCVAVRHPMARWGEGVVMVAVGFDVLFVVWAVVVGVWFGPAAVAGGGQQGQQQWQQQQQQWQQQQQQAVVGYYDYDYDYERRNYAWSDDEYRLRLALRQGDWRRAADCVLVAVMLIPGWYLAYKIHGVEPDARDFPLLGRRGRDVVAQRRRRGEEVDDMPWDEWVRIGVAQFALDFCFLVWSVLVWVE